MVKNKYLKNITRNATQKEITPENRGVQTVKKLIHCERKGSGG